MKLELTVSPLAVIALQIINQQSQAKADRKAS